MTNTPNASTPEGAARTPNEIEHAWQEWREEFWVESGHSPNGTYTAFAAGFRAASEPARGEAREPTADEVLKVWSNKFNSLGAACGDQTPEDRAARNVFFLCADYLRAALNREPTP